MGLRVGDVIVAVNGQQVASCAEYNHLARGVQRFELTLRRPTAAVAPASQRSATPQRRSHVAAKAKPAAAQPKPAARRRSPPVNQHARQIPRAEWEFMAMDIDTMNYEQLLA